MADILSAEDIAEFITRYPDWCHAENTLHAEFEFEDFKGAWGFMQKLATVMEKHNHHAAIYNVYNVVKLKLTTHDAGNKVTQKDLNVIEDLS